MDGTNRIDIDGIFEEKPDTAASAVPETDTDALSGENNASDAVADDEVIPSETTGSAVLPDTADAAAGNKEVCTEQIAIAVPAAVPKINFSTLPKMICVLLAAAGIASYGYLGYTGLGYLKNGGLGALVAGRVFGGIVSVVTPLPNVPEIPDWQTPPDDLPDNVPPPEQELPPTEDFKILSENIGCTDPDDIINETAYSVDGLSLPTSAVPEFSSGKKVLIIHTHGTEGFASSDKVSYGEDFRTEDPEESIVAVGAAFAEILRSRGIETVHCETMFDAGSYSDAYYYSGKAVAEYVKNDPDIWYVLDIHRDAVIYEDGTVVRSDNGGAQLMIVCGTDEMGANFPNWRENFAFGKAYQHKLYDAVPNLVRHMNLRSASFNEQLAGRYLLLEVGTCGNTLAEAIASARIAAAVFADLILSK